MYIIKIFNIQSKKKKVPKSLFLNPIICPYWYMLYFRSYKAYNIQSLPIMLIRILPFLINIINLAFNPVHSIEICFSWGKLDLLPLTMFSCWPLASFIFYCLLIRSIFYTFFNKSVGVFNQLLVLEFLCFVVCFVSCIICYLWRIFVCYGFI